MDKRIALFTREQVKDLIKTVESRNTIRHRHLLKKHSQNKASFENKFLTGLDKIEPKIKVTLKRRLVKPSNSLSRQAKSRVKRYRLQKSNLINELQDLIEIMKMESTQEVFLYSTVLKINTPIDLIFVDNEVSIEDETDRKLDILNKVKEYKLSDWINIVFVNYNYHSELLEYVRKKGVKLYGN